MLWFNDIAGGQRRNHGRRIYPKSRGHWLPYFFRFGQRETGLEEFTREVEGWLPFLREVALPRLTGEMLDVVQRKGATAGSLDG